MTPNPTHRKSLVPHLSPLHICEVPCGVGNVLHNKGAQAALFRVGIERGRKGGGGGTSFLFVNAHLAAHQHKVEERNADVDRVMTELQVGVCVVDSGRCWVSFIYIRRGLFLTYLYIMCNHSYNRASSGSTSTPRRATTTATTAHGAATADGPCSRPCTARGMRFPRTSWWGRSIACSSSGI